MVWALLNGHPQDTEGRILERVGETLLGVALAFLFGWVIPRLRASRGRSHG